MNMEYKDSMLDHLTYELACNYSNEYAVLLSDEDYVFKEFYARKPIVDRIIRDVGYWYPDIRYSSILKDRPFPYRMSYETRRDIDKRLEGLIGFTCSGDLINYLKNNLVVSRKQQLMVFYLRKTGLDPDLIEPHSKPFNYDPIRKVLTIADYETVEIEMSSDGVIDFMWGISKIKDNHYSPLTSEWNKKFYPTLDKYLEKGNYVKLPGPTNCSVFGVFRNRPKNILLLEVAYPDGTRKNLSVALDLDKF